MAVKVIVSISHRTKALGASGLSGHTALSHIVSSRESGDGSDWVSEAHGSETLDASGGSITLIGKASSGVSSGSIRSSHEEIAGGSSKMSHSSSSKHLDGISDSEGGAGLADLSNNTVDDVGADKEPVVLREGIEVKLKL